MHEHTWKPNLALRRLTDRWGHDLAIDLGTTTTLVYARDRGVVLAEPSVVALDACTQEVLAVGHVARAMRCKGPADIVLERPMLNGVVEDECACEALLAGCLDRIAGLRRRALAGLSIDAPVLEQLMAASLDQDGWVPPRS